MTCLIITWFSTAGNYCYGQTKSTDVKVYNDFYIHQGVIYTSGILGTDRNHNIPAIFEQEVRQLFANLDQILRKADTRKERVYSITVYLNNGE
ncbi:hypothetical protein LS482_19590 [Sinomicrobium kalidii]|uniref:RidA family protein n=1 Tax=Sinomicrobium kalidii TaxID=2900738 RepID=UPI001E56E457|nr:Rid family hydrolase [Sinomicrobium kalidii]UGU15869.1 hypothetical protein LS482_19590 [Sinomicrobium kalidii]